MSHTLYNTRDVVAKNGGKAPLTYKGFEKAIAALGPPLPPAEDPPAKLPPIGADSKGTDSEKTGVPSVRELGYPDEASTDIKVSLPSPNTGVSFPHALKMHNAMNLHWLLFQQLLLLWTCYINLSRICWSAVHHPHPPIDQISFVIPKEGHRFTVHPMVGTYDSCVAQGGETEALARLAEQLSDKAWVAAFEKPKGDPTAFIKPATTVLSPHLKFGCLSPRLFYEALQRVRLSNPLEPRWAQLHHDKHVSIL